MANILGIFTAIILAVAAFVAMKNKARLEDEITTRQTEEASLAQSQKRLKAAQEVLKALPIERAGVDEKFAAKSEEEEKLQEANAKLKSDIEEKTATIAANKTKLDEIREKLAPVGDLDTLGATMKAMRLGKGESLPALKTSIRSIYPTWGFVTLNDGNNAGVNSNSTLDVVRDGETIARLLVTAVESRSASASIIPDSIAQDVTLMVGDRVVAGSKVKKAADN